MGADNWAVCPKCVRKWVSKKDQLLSTAHKQYGKIPIEHYDKLIAEANATKQDYPENSLREDYEQGMLPEGKYYIKYKCRCDCGFSFSYEFEQKVT